MLSSTTCVGLRYELYKPDVLEAFPGSLFGALSPLSEEIGVLSLALQRTIPYVRDTLLTPSLLHNLHRYQNLN